MVFKRLKLSKTSSRPHRESRLDQLMSIEGQVSRPEVQQLMALAQNIPVDEVIVEIGTYRGRTAIALAYGSLAGHHSRVYAIDPHLHFHGAFGGHFGPQDQAQLYDNIAKYRVGEIVAVVCLASDQVARSWPSNNVGLLFLDGDHTSHAVRRDYEAWRPCMAQGGIMAFHDSNMPEVKQVLDELIQTKQILRLGEVDSLSWFQVGT